MVCQHLLQSLRMFGAGAGLAAAPPAPPRPASPPGGPGTTCRRGILRRRCSLRGLLDHCPTPRPSRRGGAGGGRVSGMECRAGGGAGLWGLSTQHRPSALAQHAAPRASRHTVNNLVLAGRGAATTRPPSPPAREEIQQSDQRFKVWQPSGHTPSKDLNITLSRNISVTSWRPGFPLTRAAHPWTLGPSGLGVARQGTHGQDSHAAAALRNTT